MTTDASREDADVLVCAGCLGKFADTNDGREAFENHDCEPVRAFAGP